MSNDTLRVQAIRDSLYAVADSVRRVYVADSIRSVEAGRSAVDVAVRRLLASPAYRDSVKALYVDMPANAKYEVALRSHVDSLLADADTNVVDASFLVGLPDVRVPLAPGYVADAKPAALMGLPCADDATAPARRMTESMEWRRYRQSVMWNYATSHLNDFSMVRSTGASKPYERRRIASDHLLEGQRVEFSQQTVRYAGVGELPKIHADRWHYRGYSVIQMSQTALSDNWYKGGENNFTIFTDQKLVVKRYDETKTSTFEATFDLKLSGYYTKADTVHAMRVSDNQFTLDAKYGYKAWKNWYYSTNLYAKTPIFEYFAANSRTPKSAFLSPLEVNVGVGMDYKKETKDKRFSYSLMLAPLSYNLKYVDLPRRVSVTSYGIDANHRALNKFGSTLTNKVDWKITKDLTWSSRLYVFTSYDGVQGEFENTFNLKVSSIASAMLYVYPRFDDTKAGKNWQMKEMTTLGFSFVW